MRESGGFGGRARAKAGVDQSFSWSVLGQTPLFNHHYLIDSIISWRLKDPF